jgi:CarD family transcriptional regulator
MQAFQSDWVQAMIEPNLAFHVGNTVIHWAHGPGVIIQLDEKEFSGNASQYYVVRTPDLTIWVPANEKGERGLRLPTPARDFKRLFRILASRGEALPTDRVERRTLLIEWMKDGKMETICRVIRDLTLYNRSKKMNEHDASIMERARSTLLSEWSMAMAVPILQAGSELKELLRSDEIPTKKS